MPDVVLPALDEEQAIPGVLAGLPPGFTPIVVDNGSRDRTAQVAREHGARVVTEHRRGFGAACFAGLRAASAEIVCFMDCDGSFDGSDLPAVAGPIEAGSAELVLGARDADAGAWPLHGRLANRYLAWELRRRVDAPVTDLGPMRAARRTELLGLGIRDRRFGWPLEMVLRAGAAGWRIREVPVAYHPRTGRSKVTGTVGGTIRAVRDMAKVLQ